MASCPVWHSKCVHSHLAFILTLLKPPSPHPQISASGKPTSRVPTQPNPSLPDPDPVPSLVKCSRHERIFITEVSPILLKQYVLWRSPNNVLRFQVTC